MTFKEAITIIYAAADTYGKESFTEAVRTVKWYENNVLELEDYETDQLYKALEYIEKIQAKDYHIAFTEERLRVQPYTTEAAKIIHSEEFKAGVKEIIERYRKEYENKKD